MTLLRSWIPWTVLAVVTLTVIVAVILGSRPGTAPVSAPTAPATPRPTTSPVPPTPTPTATEESSPAPASPSQPAPAAPSGQQNGQPAQPVAPVAQDPAPPGEEPAPPAPPADTTPPTVSRPGVVGDNCVFVVAANVSDDVGVTQVTMKWSGTATGTSAMRLFQGRWVGEGRAVDGDYKVTVTARDAAGNVTTSAATSFHLLCAT